MSDRDDAQGVPRDYGLEGNPPEVCASLNYLYHVRYLETPITVRGEGGRPRVIEGRKLDLLEHRTYDAALELLRRYFSGDDEYAPDFDLDDQSSAGMTA